MSLMDDLRARAAARPMRVAFFEATDPKILATVDELTGDGLAQCVLVGDAADIKDAATEQGVDLTSVELVDVTDDEATEAFAQRFESEPDSPFKPKATRRRAKRPQDRALMMQRLGDVDVTFGGIACSTGDVIIGAQTIIGLAPGVDTVSSCGLALVPGFDGPEGELLGIADSAVCADPNPAELASIAAETAKTIAALTGWEPRVALLSYSTDGSAEGPLVEKVQEAVKIAHERWPELAIDGEFQFDAAIRPEIAAKKVHRESPVAGRANIVVWPNLDVGNVGVKLIQTFGRADAYGPFLQGFNKIVCDCSRSAPVSELVGNVVMSCVRAQAFADEQEGE